MRYRYILIIGLLAIGLFTGFQASPGEEDSRERIIERGIQIKVEEFRTRQMAECRNRAIELAVVRVDSIIRAMARHHMIDPVQKPPRSTKPEKPEIKQLPDTLPDEF